MARLAAGFFLLAALAVAAAPPPAEAQPIGVIVVDKERVLRESAVAQRLAAQEKAARAALQAEYAELSRGMEAEEAEIAALREQVDKEVFDARVRAFNDTVQQSQRTIQRKNEEIQRQFVNARRQISEALAPVLFQLMEAKGAALIIDRRSVLAARAGAEMTDEVIAEFNAATAEMFPAAVAPQPDEE